MFKGFIKYGIILLISMPGIEGFAHDELYKKTFETTYHNFTLVNNLIVIEAEISGIKGNFILDTGSSGLLLNANLFSSVRSSNNLLHGVNNSSVEMGSKWIKEFRFGNLIKRNFNAGVIPFDHIESSMDTQIHGLVGMDVLANVDILIEYDARLITIQGNFTAFKNPDATLPFELVDGIPIIKGSIQGKSVLLAVDYGASITLLDKSILDPTAFDQIQKIDLIGTNGRVQALDKVVCNDLKIGDDYMFNTSAVLLDLSHLQSEGIDIQGVLGTDLLYSRRVLISQSNSQLLIWEN